MGKNEFDLMVLGSLVLGPAHGYQLKKRITGSFGSVYPNLSNSVIYPRLAKFQQKGYIKCKIEPQANAPKRKIYWLTDEGFKRVKELTATPIKLTGAVQSGYTDELTVHIVFFGLISKEERRRIVEPFYDFTLKRLEEVDGKRERYSAVLDKFNVALLEYAGLVLKSTVDLYRKLLEI
jgi:DNA-binding PadR family transcriptional regulator